ncbi:putative leucine-rich repeat-containing, plant-type, leucine-rich repeat domain superfamily [Helianthus annuus]|nr:putative leucine-rich repeat-containing, plant-type, leucine-rich repeat domain superfamily [Helianthus annuus]
MAKSTNVFMLILVLCLLQSALANMFSSLSLPDEYSLLFQFKENISINNSASFDSHAYPKVSSWNLNRSDGAGNCCLWDGVECKSGNVIGLDLSNSFLYGPISSNNSLFNLIHLRTLNLADNDFCSSQIPSKIGRVSLLANLNLSRSLFSREIPKQISQLRNLASLDLTGNGSTLIVNIDSELPTSIGNLTRLNILKLSNCGLAGTLHASVGNLTRLTVLDLGNNYFSGPIPSGIFNLQTLQLLDVHCNYKLTGHIPEFHGSIPASIWNLTHLKVLDLGFSSFTGTLHASVSNMTQLTFLDLSGIEFTGSLPSLERFSNLAYLSLSGSSFDRWKLPDWFGKLKKITYLNLEDVNLYGEIPSSFFNLTRVGTLVLSRNQLIGQLPSSLLNLQNLESFYLDGNNATVDFYLFLSLKNLNYLNLRGNNIRLSVIDSHKTETQFKVLWRASCNLKVFPEFLRFQHQLEFLYLDNNKIEGLIPGWMWNISKETLIELRLSQKTY